MIGATQMSKRKRVGSVNSEKNVAKRVKQGLQDDKRVRTEPRRSLRKVFAVKDVIAMENITNGDDLKVKKEVKGDASTNNNNSVAMVKKEEMNAMERVKEERESDDMSCDSSDEEGDGMSYERKRLKNIQENAKLFAELGIFQAKAKLRDSFGQPKSDVKKPSRNGLKSKPKAPEPLPRRMPSLRIRGLDPHGTPLPEVPKEPEPEPERHPRKPSGPMEVKPSNVEDSKESAVFQNAVTALCDTDIKPCKNTPELDRFLGEVSKMTITEDRVAKVVPDRIFSIAIHPSVSKTLVFAGGKWGSLGLWDVGAKSKTADNGVYAFEPHSRPITCLALPKQQPDKIYSCSYDGTVRCGDFNKMVFNEVCAATYGFDVWYSYLDFLSEDGSELVVGQMMNREGSIAIVDTRSNNKVAENVYGVHHRSVKTVNVHPTQRHYVMTASTDSTVAVWDIRNLKGGGKSNKPLVSVPHTRTVTSAFFSPLTGNKIVTTAFDDRLRVLNFSTTENSKKVEAEVVKSVRHDNHVGRWLTPFKAVWHPSREDVFVCGSMSRPRQIELFNEHCHHVHNFKDEENLGSVCSINAFHPTRNILVGGNSSGRVHIFM
ncbi:WD repeat-containing protein 76-like [Ptychodera flava]|uniref:WD repeat-containing protein 76-like n=1 Tax=Ptychodera flava TaxID=63121 RepID=UPI00396A2F17